MSNAGEQLTDQEIGERLRIAREGAKMTQAAAANAIDVARTTIVAIEQGQRRARIDEVQKLATAYRTSANAILRQEAVHVDMVPRFRKLPQSSDGSIDEAASLLNLLVRAEVELENILGVKRQSNFPPERPILPGDVRLQAEQDAQELRDWLGLGSGPVIDIVSILSLQLGIRVYVRRFDGKVSGLFAFDESVGACILLNANHPPERVRQTGSHELAHFVATRKQPEALIENEVSDSRDERYASCFSRAFLTPARAVRQRFAEITAGQTHLTRRHVIWLANSFGVSREAMVRRLEELSLAKNGTWDWFEANGGISNEQARQVLGNVSERPVHAAEAEGVVPPRLALLVREAWKRDFYTEGQLSRLLQLDRHEIRELLEGVEREENEADELVKLPY